MLENLLYVKNALGQYGQPIRIYKLRTMVPDADKEQPDISFEQWSNLGKIEGDPRVTTLGKLLRRYWIDELPQLVNLLRGDISLVGIRPLHKDTTARYPPDHLDHIQQHKPGLFGIQYAHDDIESFEDMVDVEAAYLKQKDRSPLLTDIKYFLKVCYAIIVKGVRSK